MVDYADVHEMVTATAFAPDGRRAVVGTMKGRCRFYACEPSFRLEYQAQIGACAHDQIPGQTCACARNQIPGAERCMRLRNQMPLLEGGHSHEVCQGG